MVKHYNPFKMWGSWIGAILLGFPATIIILLATSENIYNRTTNMEWAFGITAGVFLGFLIGWGIHSLVRALRK